MESNRFWHHPFDSDIKFHRLMFSLFNHLHEYVMLWKRFPHYWPFVRGESTGHRLIPCTKGQVMMRRSFDDSFDVRLDNLLNKQSSCRLFKTSWRLCNATVVVRAHNKAWIKHALILSRARQIHYMKSKALKSEQTLWKIKHWITSAC